jgi:hypothetical protein
VMHYALRYDGKVFNNRESAYSPYGWCIIPMFLSMYGSQKHVTACESNYSLASGTKLNILHMGLSLPL